MLHIEARNAQEADAVENAAATISCQPYSVVGGICILSHRQKIPGSYLSSCVDLLHRTILDFQGSKAFFHRFYEQLDVDDSLLAKIAEVYKSTYSQEDIVLSPKPAPQTARKSPRTRARRPPRPKRYLSGQTGAEDAAVRVGCHADHAQRVEYAGAVGSGADSTNGDEVDAITECSRRSWIDGMTIMIIMSVYIDW